MPEMSLLLLVAIACATAWLLSLGFAYSLCRAAARTPPAHRRLPRQVSAHTSRVADLDAYR